MLLLHVNIDAITNRSAAQSQRRSSPTPRMGRAYNMSIGTPLRQFVYRQLEAERPEKRGLSPTNWAILFLILFSLALYTAETEREIQFEDGGILWFLNVFVLLFFGAEFVLRLCAVGVDERFRGWRGLGNYVRSNWLMVTVDFVAFAPELFLLAIGLSPPSLLRALRVARLLKIARYFPAFKLVLDALRSCANELMAALAVAVMLWYFASVLLYLVEGDAQPEGFGSITRAMWWSVVTLTTVGYGDVYPTTAFGKVVAGLIAILGIGAVAMPSGILAGTFMEKLRDRSGAASKDRAG
jgi:voltage-gated potassium channel